MEVKSSGKERRRLSSSTPPKRPLTQKPSTSDENDQYYQQVGNSNLQSPKKPLTKNYMSPTISAASKSKATALRKNILGERNEASDPDFSNTHVEKSHVAIDNASESLSQALPKAPPSFQSHDVDETLSDDLSSRPYDPVTNYLSPRPQFLRYRPNRRQELFLGLENGVGFSMSRSASFDSQKSIDEEVGAVTTPSSLASPHQDGPLEKEDEEVELNDEENEGSDEENERSDEEGGERDEEECEEVEEEKGGKLKGVLKSSLLLLLIVLFASHMSPMNHQIHFEGVEDGYCGIQNTTIEASLLKKLESGGTLWDQKEERHTGFVEIVKGANEMEVEDVIGRGEDTHIDEEIEDEVKVEDENLGDVEFADEMREVVEELQAEEIEEKKVGIDGLGEVVVLLVEDTEKISDTMVENSESQGAGPSMSDFDHENLVFHVSNALEEDKVGGEQIDGMVEKKMEEAEESSTNMAAEPVMPKTMDNDTGFDEAYDLKAEGNWKEELINFMKSKTFYTTAIGVSVFSVIVASLASVFHFKQRNTTKKDSSLIVRPSAKPLVIEQKKINGNVSPPPSKPYSETVIAERYNSELPSTGDDSIEHVYSSFRRMSLSSKHSTGAVHSQAPTVELLDELVFGEVSSSLRSMTEGEESNYSVSSKKLGSKAQSVSIQAQPAVSEFSSMDLHSYGSFSTPRKVMKKKAGNQDGEVTTPLRRSSRLRNKMVTSP
ncbi:uncharacterized protein LOC103931053 [Pyrus x bretschneideri]|uniref:uncharacterized protein LOC103931053 n=1 Tax=Pyrus x bretschneideri TaxID=225117 RepID=UPI00202DC292|nr:uncharacterized protein LOC103931053 [Pyrus x bretschneideri]